MNETMVTLQGWLGSDVTLRTAGDAPVASFRVGCTPRRFQKKTGDWVDGETQWYSVSAWRALAEHCDQSLRRGDPVVVHGRINAQKWTNGAGLEVTSFEVDAVFVGHDLNRGVSSFRKTTGAAEREMRSVPASPEPSAEEEAPAA